MSKKEEKYQLTFKGLLMLSTNYSEDATQALLDKIELFLRKRKENAIILTDDGFITTKVKKVK